MPSTGEVPSQVGRGNFLCLAQQQAAGFLAHVVLETLRRERLGMSMTESRVKSALNPASPLDPRDRNPMNTEVWQCPACRARADLLAVGDDVLLSCSVCGLVDRGHPAPNFDVD